MKNMMIAYTVQFSHWKKKIGMDFVDIAAKQLLFSLSLSFTYKHSIHTLGSSLFHHQQQNNKNNNELCWLLCNNKCSTVKVGFPEQCVFSLLGFFINSLDLIYIFFFVRVCDINVSASRVLTNAGLQHISIRCVLVISIHFSSNSKRHV